MFLNAKHGKIIEANAVIDNAQQFDPSFSKLVYALLPTYNESLFRQWLNDLVQARLDGSDNFLFHLITGDFNKAVRLCNDPRLAAVIASFSTNQQDEKFQGLIKRQIRQFQLGRTKYDLGWEVIAGNPIDKDPIISLAIKLNYGGIGKGKSILDILKDLKGEVLGRDGQFYFLENAFAICAEFDQKRLNELISLLPNLRSRLELALHLNADPLVVNKLKDQFEELHPRAFDSLIAQGRFYEAGCLLSAQLPSEDLGSLSSEIGQIPDNYLNLFFPKLLIAQLSQRLPILDVNSARLLGSLMNRDPVYIRKEKKLRIDLASYLAREHQIFVENDLPPDTRLLYL
jgi:hypothetical protein